MQLHSKIIGQGEPLIVLHGFLGMGDNWKTHGKNWADLGYEVHLVDQRNHGRSPHSEAFNYTLLAEDIKTYCTQHNLDKINLLGHSMGGKTSMVVATHFPNLVKKLIVVDISPKQYAPHHENILNGLSYLSQQNLTSRRTADELLSSFVPEASVRQFLLKNLYWIEKDKLALRMHLDSFLKNKKEVGASLPKKALYEGPTLFIKGGNSNYISASDEQLIPTHFPKAQLKTIENTGHWVHAEQREQFFKVVTNFLKMDS